MFAIGDFVVYGSNGICEVKDLAPIDIPGMSSDRMYYHLSPIGTKESRVYSPVDNTKVVMRAVLTAEDAKSIIDRIGDIPELEIVSDKLMEVKYKETIASCDIEQLIGMIKTIKKKQQKRQEEGKKITATDERYLKKAEESVCGEFSFVLKLDKSEVEKMLKEGR